MNHDLWLTDRPGHAPRRPLVLPAKPERADDEEALDTLLALLGKASAEKSRRLVLIDVRLDEDLDPEP